MADLYKNLNKEVENDLAGYPRKSGKRLFLFFLIFAAAGASVWLGVSAFGAVFGKTTASPVHREQATQAMSARDTHRESTGGR